MSDDYEAEREAQLVAEYNRLVNEFNRQVVINEQLQIEVAQGQNDVMYANNLVGALLNHVLPPMKGNTDDVVEKETIAANVSRAIDDLVDSYKLLKNSSTATKNLTGSYDKYYTQFGLYNELRQVTLGYTVGLDTNLWKSDTPRKTVEKMYLANTDYWLAYAIMAVMLWASDEEAACARAVSKSMQMNERKSALFFLLTALRFNRTDAAKEWYYVYFDLVDAGGIGDEIIYILQALLCGAFGKDVAFAQMVEDKMRALIEDARKKTLTKQLVAKSIDNHISALISVTDKEYLGLKHICAEYDEMMELLSTAEKNQKLKDYFLSVIHDDFSMSDRLAERIEDALYSLISTHDDAEQELLDKIAYEEAIVKSHGKIDVAKEHLQTILAERDNQNNIALVMVDAALDGKMKTDCRVRRFSFETIRTDCTEAVKKFSSYRNREKKEYAFNVDGCALKGDENSFDVNKPKLEKYYDGLIRERIKSDKAVKTTKIVSGVSAVLAVLFVLLGVVGFVASWPVGASVTLLILGVLGIGVFAWSIVMGIDQRKKIRKSFEFRIQNGIKMLDEGLKDLGAWRKEYKAQDAVLAELMQVLQEEK